MKKFIFRSTQMAAAVAALTLAGAVSAQTNSNNTTRTSYMGSSYIDVGVGESDFSLGNGIGIFGADQGDRSYSLRFGRYINENWGMELGYTDFGSINRAGGRTKADGINISLIGKMPLGASSFNLLGKVGTTYSRTDVSSDITSGIVPGSDKGFKMSYGVGVEYGFTPQMSVALQYETHNMKFAGDRDDRVGATTLSARYSF